MCISYIKYLTFLPALSSTSAQITYYVLLKFQTTFINLKFYMCMFNKCVLNILDTLQKKSKCIRFDSRPKVFTAVL